ncbi:MAG TPA: hypothetical protein VMG38_06625 [Trebonia sp.]|nr:hypothetical protein [Trebonia sp.]
MAAAIAPVLAAAALRVRHHNIHINGLPILLVIVLVIAGVLWARRRSRTGKNVPDRSDEWPPRRPDCHSHGHGQILADAAKAAADAGWREVAGRARPLLGQADVGGQVAGQVQLGAGGDDEPGPATGGGRVAELRAGPAGLLL